jgi:hypothetical protein
MKISNLLSIALFLFSIHSNAQIKVSKITANNQDHYITTKIDYPILGLYQFENISEPIVILNADGTGVFQYKDLTKKEMTWGLECTEDGFLRFKEGFDSAAYSLWIKPSKNLITPDADENYEWKKVEFSIHYNTKKMYIMGERVKVYVDPN